VFCQVDVSGGVTSLLQAQQDCNNRQSSTWRSATTGADTHVPTEGRAQDNSGKFQEAKDKRFCVLQGLTGAAMELTVKMKMGQDLAVYPEDRDMSAVSFVRGVIAQQFPCQKAQ
jgi:hypothetical protein